MLQPFSKRTANPATNLTHEMNIAVRQRFWHMLQERIASRGQRSTGQFNDHTQENARFWKEAVSKLREWYGALDGVFIQTDTDTAAGIKHLMACSPERALDFVELCLATIPRENQAAMSTATNELFDEVGLAYQITPPTDIPYPAPKSCAETLSESLGILARIPPHVIPRSDSVTHTEIVAPALRVLSDPLFAVANSELLNAFADHRAGRHADVITACGSAFESVLKTICDAKGWAYDGDKDTCSRLVNACQSQGLFPSFYGDIFKQVGTVRNKLGAAHGRGPTAMYKVEPAHAEHLLHLVCSHILLLCGLARLEISAKV